MRYDVKFVNHDLDLSTGDIEFDVSDIQHVEDTINAAPGWWKSNPTDGVNISADLSGPPDIQDKTKRIKQQLQIDGYRVGNPKITFNARGRMTINPDASF